LSSFKYVLTDGDDPFGYRIQGTVGKGFLFANPLFDDFYTFAARDFGSDPAIRSATCPIGDYAEKVLITIWRKKGIGEAFVLAALADLRM
jgi:hypothetical protein